MDKVNITKHTESFIKINCSAAIKYEIRDEFTFFAENYKFHPKYRAKVWDGKIRLFNMQSSVLPAGLLFKLLEFLKDRGYAVDIAPALLPKFDFSLEDAVDFVRDTNLPKEITPRQYQVESFKDIINIKKILLLSPTGSGKSLLIYLTLKYLRECGFKKILIVVPRIQLTQQLLKEFVGYSQENKWDIIDDCHLIYSGQSKTTPKPIVISTWQSLMREVPDFFHDYDAVIVDEAHEAKAKEVTKIMENSINARYRIGVTGSLDDIHINQMTLEGLFGPKCEIVTTKELIDDGFLSKFQIKAMVLKYPELDCKALAKATYDEEMNFLVNDPRRNDIIASIAMNVKGNTLVMFRYVDNINKPHGRILFETILASIPSDSDKKVFFVSGKTKIDVRESIREIVENEKNAIIVASDGVFSMGINIKSLEHIIFASPSKSMIKILQSIGRVLRLHDDKAIATLYDISDDLRYKKSTNYFKRPVFRKSGKKSTNYTLKHFLERIKLYGKQQFSFKIFNYNVKEK